MQKNNLSTTCEELDGQAEIKYNAFQARMILLHQRINNKKPKLLDLYLDKVARVVGVTRDKKEGY